MARPIWSFNFKNNNYYMEGTRPLTGPALPNLINAVRMFKVKVKNRIG